MTQELPLLLGSAAAVAAIHTLAGPDHYLPFVMMAKARKWSIVKTTWITILCGLGHCASSVGLGLAGLAAWASLQQIGWLESIRGDFAAWLLVAFGLTYCVWGVWRAIKGRRHTHAHVHTDDQAHAHEHAHEDEHVHVHTHAHPRKSITPWVLFAIFVFGPCEPLIPLVMAGGGLGGIVLVSVTFTAVTISVMLAAVLLGVFGLRFVSFKPLERWSHALAGLVVAGCGAAIFLGL